MLRPLRVPSANWKRISTRLISSVPPKMQLPSEKEARRSPLGRKTTEFLDRTQSKLMALLQRVNDVSGYSEIENLKRKISQAEIDAKQSREDREKASIAYQRAVAERSASQREVNELLQRKHDWSGQDLERFTQLFREDHLVEQRVQQTKAASLESEARYDSCQAQLHQLISSRYREEQIWSDKIRQVSTWGTVLLMAFNVLLFLVVQLGLEPWKRRRLVGSFEEKVLAALDERIPVNNLEKVVSEPAQEDSELGVVAPGPDAALDRDQPAGILDSVLFHLNDLWIRVTSPKIILQPIEAAVFICSALSLGIALGLSMIRD